MIRWSFLVAGLAFIATIVDLARSQISGPETSGRAQKEFVLGRHIGEQLERRDGVIGDPALLGYIQGLGTRLAGAAGTKPVEIRITRSPEFYARFLPHGVLYVSGALFERLESEAELAGLLAHQLAHVRAPATDLSPACVFAPQISPARAGESQRDLELHATESAVQTLRTAGYDPTAVLDLFSKLAYEHPEWAKAIVPEDLITLRATVEADVVPEPGYMANSSAFVQQQATVAAALRHSGSKR